MDNIQKLYELPTPKIYTTSKAVPLHNPAPQLLYGIELEIENCQHDMAVNGMEQTTDGSLRNNGLEFITRPMTYSHMHYVLEMFFRKNKLSDANYSERTSVHVHTNVLDLTLSQIAAIALVYQVFEGVLFNWIGHDRRKNIFCVPWADTTLSYRTVQRLGNNDTNPLHDWQKYTALNLKPIQAQGSIEWRHMEGNCDLSRIMTWCRLIGHIYQFATSADLKTVQGVFMNLNTTSQYLGALQQVFRDDHQVLRCNGYEQLLEDGVLDMKYSLINPLNTTTINAANTLTAMQALQERIAREPINRDWTVPDWGAFVNQPQEARVDAIRAAVPPALRRQPPRPARGDRVMFFDDVLNNPEGEI